MTLADAVSKVRTLTGAGDDVFADSAIEMFLADRVLDAEAGDYDIYGTCADVCDYWAARASADYDVAVGGETFNRSQVATALRESAKAFRRRAVMRVGTISRSDEQWR